MALICSVGLNATVYVNVLGGFNNWLDNGLEPVNNVTTHTLAIGTTEFKVKVWDGSKDNWYSTGGAITIGQTTTISGNNDANMTISGASSGETFIVTTEVINGTGTNGIKLTITRTSGGGGGGGTTPDPDNNYAWPANYQGVMLQGFYWDSYSDTRWTNLTANVEEYSKYFSLIWVPNGAKAATAPSMGYDPVYWFTNYTSTFGTEAELREMIQTYKNKGVGIIADVVINHRSGVSNWTDFPSETWNGVTYKLGPEHICCTDEVKDQSGQPKPTGAADTGEDFNGARDLDHTNATVQTNVKAYLDFLLNDMGFVGFRYDMVKGYGAQYTKLYNESAKPTYSVGEYFDGSYDAVKAWIDGTGKQSAAFDFPFKYAVNNAFSANDMSQLAWLANGTTAQPAGMIHFAYPQYAVTFIDNHDTFKDHNKFTGDVLAANAFMLCSPGTPCVFLAHYKANKIAMQSLIAIRNAVGVHNMSTVNVLKTSTNCYMAEVTGTNGTLVVRIGSSTDSPSGYTADDIKASGTNYCVWTKVAVELPEQPVNPDAPFDVYFRNSDNWTTPYVHYWGGDEESTWPGKAMTLVSGNVWVYTVPKGTTGLVFNANSTPQTEDFAAWADHIYSPTGDEGKYVTDDPNQYPDKLYLVGNIPGTHWDTSTSPIPAEGNKGVYNWYGVTLEDAGSDTSYFSFLTTTGPDWNTVNSSDRYGAATKDAPVTVGTPVDVVLYAANVSASGALSWKATPGTYDMTVDINTMKLTLKEVSGVDDIEMINTAAPIYYNLQGVEVSGDLAPGVYIRRIGNQVSKILVR